jgi:uncharacterized protein involved in response to NO
VGLDASRGTQAIYIFALIAAATRVLAALLPHWAHALLHVAAFTWIAAFGGFCLVYGPMLLRPRIRMERARGMIAVVS